MNNNLLFLASLLAMIGIVYTFVRDYEESYWRRQYKRAYWSLAVALVMTAVILALIGRWAWKNCVW